MPLIPLGTTRRITIDPNPIYNYENDTYRNYYYRFKTSNKITVIFEVINAEYNIEYDYRTTNLTIRFYTPTNTFTRTFRQHIDTSW